mmetsp:Transcript_12201/g.26493  ORF Transcript_12201/g.26493 Transcript_12201/m.26493 type:complete len:256 (+) Transcript_12201:2690-3457(+)
MEAESFKVLEGFVVSIPEKTKVKPSRHRGVNGSIEKLGLLLGSDGRSADAAWGLLMMSDPARSGMDSISFELGGWYLGGPAGVFSALAFFAAGFLAVDFFLGEADLFFFTGLGLGLSSSDAHSSSSSSSSLPADSALDFGLKSSSESEDQSSVLPTFFLAALDFGLTSSSDVSNFESSFRLDFLAAGAALAGFFFGGGGSLSSSSSSSSDVDVEDARYGMTGVRRPGGTGRSSVAALPWGARTLRRIPGEWKPLV